MNSCSSIPSNSECSLKVYRYRWIIIIIYAVFCLINFFHFMQFAIIADIVEEYYGVSALLTNMSGLVFMITFILFFIPIGYLVENTSMKTTALISTGLTALGNGLKLFATTPGTYNLILVSQTLVAIAQIFMLIIPSKVACLWFGSEEVSTACAIGVFGCQIGVALGAFIPSAVVTYNNDNNVTEKQFNSMFIGNVVASVAIFIAVIFLFRSKPRLPPSQSQANLISTENEITYWTAIKGFAKNRDFIIVLFTLGIGLSMFNVSGLLINQIYKHFFPEDKSGDLGLYTSIAIITGGCFGTVIFGYILDTTHKFKLVSFIILLGTFICTIVQSIFTLTSNRTGTLALIPINGFFSGSIMVIGYEYAIETTYPTPEAFGAAIYNAAVYVFSIIYVLILPVVFDYWGYVAGHIIMVVSLGLATFGILLISPELKRRDANLKPQMNGVHS